MVEPLNRGDQAKSQPAVPTRGDGDVYLAVVGGVENYLQVNRRQDAAGLPHTFVL